MSRRASERKRPIAVCGESFPSSLTSCLSYVLRRAICDQIPVRQPLPSDRRTHFSKTLAIVVLSLIEPERLFVQIPAQMRRINTDVSSFEGTFQEAPEILDVVGVNLPGDKLDRVVNHLMRIGAGKAQIRFESVSVESRPCLNGSADLRCECPALHVRNMRGFDPAGPPLTRALDDTEDSFFPRTASALDLTVTNMPVHVLGETANECFVGLDLSAHLKKRAGLHCEPDSVIHEPRSLLSDTECPMHLVAADPVLAVCGHPDRGEPLPQVDGTILKDGSDLGRELPARMLLLALPQPTCSNEPDIGSTACRAVDAIRPAQLDHRAHGDIRIGEISDGFNEGLGFVHHTDQYDSDRLLCQVYYHPNLGIKPVSWPFFRNRDFFRSLLANTTAKPLLKILSDLRNWDRRPRPMPPIPRIFIYDYKRTRLRAPHIDDMGLARS
jgi:hypothetical protein